MYCRNRASYQNFKLKLWTCAQSQALGTRTKFQFEILATNVISCGVYSREIILESSRKFSETTSRALIYIHQVIGPVSNLIIHVLSAYLLIVYETLISLWYHWTRKNKRRFHKMLWIFLCTDMTFHWFRDWGDISKQRQTFICADKPALFMSIRKPWYHYLFPYQASCRDLLGILSGVSTLLNKQELYEDDKTLSPLCHALLFNTSSFGQYIPQL